MRSHQKTMLLLASVFLVPLILAWVVLKMGWFERGALSHGQWLEPPMQLENYQVGKWSIAQVIKDDCLDVCSDNLVRLNTAWLALGIAKQKTQRLALISEAKEANIDAGYARLAITQSNQGLAGYDQQWLVVDPTGWVILSYQPAQGDEQVKGLITDVKRLIKNSRFQ
ncbi:MULTISPECIES: hypothetical protein [unclassified Agarivorans]|uniref:hypothetical protein n=1 Tax=unclassified Agarivorans TaxID=2636026 RepID=UPI0026E20FA9|nr:MULTISPECIES: hypothetical protein [unclassified Agarivorans]MDO6687575.1 hypothetical protein [Agarivorans sp. 3_MG-2023]MDO6717092.1 hypothetical protein [Agarivorans sp. 2_MG-2023]